MARWQFCTARRRYSSRHAPPPRIVRRADHVRKVEKRVTHRELAVSHRLHPPRVDAGEKARMGDKMRVERSLIDDLATRDVNQDRVEGIEKYLASGMIRGIGPVYAKKLVRAFGEAVFDVIEQEPPRLRQVTGIGPKRAE